MKNDRGQYIEDTLLGKLVKPKNGVLLNTQLLFDKNYGIITVAEWYEDDREMYVEIFVQNKTIVRKYPALSVFEKFWTVMSK